MPITELQRIERTKHLGSSDMAAVLGLDEYRTGWDVWAEKTGRLDPDTKTDAKEAVRLGNFLEQAVLSMFEDVTGLQLVRNVHRVVPETPLAANMDAAIINGDYPEGIGEPVEAKSTGIMSSPWRASEDWGDEGSDIVPERVIVQCHVHMLTYPLGVPQCHVPAIVAGKGFVRYVVPFNQTIADLIRETACRFWRDQVEADRPPANSRPSMEVVRRMRRISGKVGSVDPETAAMYLKAKDEFKTAEDTYEVAKAAVLEQLGDAEAGNIPGGGGAFTYYENTVREHVVKEYQRRTLRHTKKEIPHDSGKDES